MSEEIVYQESNAVDIFTGVGSAFGDLPEPKSIEKIKENKSYRDRLFDLMVEENKIIINSKNWRWKTYEEGALFGIIPGTEQKNPDGSQKKQRFFVYHDGVEFIANAFNLSIGPMQVNEFEITHEYEGKQIKGHLEIECKIAVINVLNGSIVRMNTATASTMESRHRFRKANKACPECKKETIRRDKKKKAGGWYCWSKIGGCGKQFLADDPKIVDQPVGQVENLNPYDQRSTVRQMAIYRCERSITDMTGMSNYFVDPEVANQEDVPPPAETQEKKQKSKAEPKPQITDEEIQRLKDDVTAEYSGDDAKALKWLKKNTITDDLPGMDSWDQINRFWYKHLTEVVRYGAF